MLRPRSPQRGLTLIEVLIAVLVLAVGLLGIAGLQSAALSNNLISYQYTQASSLAQAMIERMRANRDGVLSGAYVLTAAASPPAAAVNCATSACTSAQQAQWDIAAIYSQISSSANITNIPNGPRAVLPGSRLSITCDPAGCAADSLRIVTVYWDAGRNGATGTNCGSERNQLRCLRLGYLP